METVTDDNDMGAWEIFLPKDFNHDKFAGDVSCGAGALWLIEMENEDGFKRYKGCLINTEGWPTLSLDLGPDYAYVNARHGQKMTREQIAIETFKAIGGTELYKDGKRIA